MTAFVDLLLHTIVNSELHPGLIIIITLCLLCFVSFKALVERLKVLSVVETVLLHWVQLGDLLFALCRS